MSTGLFMNDLEDVGSDDFDERVSSMFMLIRVVVVDRC